GLEGEDPTRGEEPRREDRRLRRNDQADEGRRLDQGDHEDDPWTRRDEGSDDLVEQRVHGRSVAGDRLAEVVVGPWSAVRAVGGHEDGVARDLEAVAPAPRIATVTCREVIRADEVLETVRARKRPTALEPFLHLVRDPVQLHLRLDATQRLHQAVEVRTSAFHAFAPEFHAFVPHRDDPGRNPLAHWRHRRADDAEHYHQQEKIPHACSPSARKLTSVVPTGGTAPAPAASGLRRPRRRSGDATPGKSWKEAGGMVGDGTSHEHETATPPAAAGTPAAVAIAPGGPGRAGSSSVRSSE